VALTSGTRHSAMVESGGEGMEQCRDIPVAMAVLMPLWWGTRHWPSLLDWWASARNLLIH